MPVLTFYIAENQSDSLRNLCEFAHRRRALRCDIPGAKPANVHIIFANAKPGCGQSACAGLFYRLATWRTAEVMENFIREPDCAIYQASGLMSRIRCFGSMAEHIFARN